MQSGVADSQIDLNSIQKSINCACLECSTLLTGVVYFMIDNI